MDKKRCTKHLGFTNKLALILVVLLTFGLFGGFYLAIKSIHYNYTGQLLCYTVVFTPLGTALAVVLGKIVDKNRDENTGPNGEGIVYATAQSVNFVDSSNCTPDFDYDKTNCKDYTVKTGSDQSPRI